MKFFNFIVCKTSFKMETLKSVIAVMRPQEWMTSVDLKDAYFHIGVVPTHRQYLRFHWLGQSYQFRALPFGMTSAPWLFTKTLAPHVAWLRLIGVPVPRQHPHSKGVSQRSRAVSSGDPPDTDSNPTQDLVYIGARFWIDLGRVYLQEDRIEGLLALVRSFSKVGQYVSALFLSLLGLMAATLQSVEYAHLCMRPIQWYLK